MEEGNKYKMAAHIKPGVGLLPGDGGIEALIRAARIVGRCCSEGRPKRGGGLRPPLGTAASSRPFACGAAACFPKARPGSCHLLLPRASGSLSLLGRAVAPSPSGYGGLQVGVR